MTILKERIQMRKDKGFTRRELSIRSGVTEQTIFELETKRVHTSSEIAVKLSDVLGVTVDKFLGIAGDTE